MSTNLFEYPNRFSLVDVDAVITTDFYIREPIGFSDIKITLERSKDHGFDFEYSADDESYGFNRVKIAGETYSGYTFLKEIHETIGVDANVQMIFESYVSGVWVEMYRGNLDFSTYMRSDALVEIKLRRVSLDDKFRTRMETAVNFASEESIEGVALTALTDVELFCHGTNKEGSCLIGTTGDFFQFVKVEGSDHTSTIANGLEILLDTTEIKVDGENYKLAYRDDVEFYSILEDNDELIVIFNTVCNFIIPSIGGYITETSVTFDGAFFTNSIAGGTTVYILYVKYIDGVFDSQVVLYSYVSTDDSIIPINFTANGLSERILYTDTGYIEHKIQLYLEFVPSGDLAQIDVFDLQWTTQFKASPTPGTLTTAYKPFNATNHILKSICDTDDDLLVSDFLENDLDDIVLTNGYKLRNAEDRNVIESFSTIFKKWMQPSFGLGMAVVDDTGFKVLIEPYGFFYQNVEIDYIDTVVDGTFKVTHDKEYCFNEIEVGYETFPNATIENKQRSLLEFNTKHDLVTPIKTVKNKGKFVSSIVASGVLIDNQRLTQFSETPNVTGDNDDVLFCIDTLVYNEYDVDAYFIEPNYIILKNSFYDIRVGESIVITASTSNNGTYTVDSVTAHLTSTDDFFSGIQIRTIEQTIVNETDNPINLNFTGSRRQAARNENFDTLTGVSDADTTYNAALNPKVMLINQSPLLNSGFHPKDGASIVKTTFAKLNNAMEFKFDAAPSHSLVATSQTISMEGDLALTDLDSNSKLFTGNYIRFTARLSFARLLIIRAACLKEYGGSKDYGYLRVKDELGVDWKVFLTKITYIAGNEKAEFEGREKYTA